MEQQERRNRHCKEGPKCTCEGTGGSERGAGMGPASGPDLLAKGSGACKHPQTPAQTDPATECQ